MTAKLDRTDYFIYGAMGVSMLALLAFRGGDLLQGIANQSAIARTSQTAAKDNAVAEQRFGMGCNTGFVMQNGARNLIPNMTALDARTGVPIAPGALLCDQSGATAIVGADGTVTDMRVSARVRKTFLDKGLGVQ